MALPVGLTTFTLTFGDYTDGQGAPALVGTTAKLYPVDPSNNKRVPLTHAASGQVIVPVDITVTVLDGGTATVSGLPHTGQAGLSPSGWAWRVEWNLPSSHPSHPKNRTFLVPSGSSVDYDLLAPAATIPAVAVSLPTVLSVAGLTGAVGVEDLADELSDAGGVTPAGGAGGALSGSYPNPGLNETSVENIVVGSDAVRAAYARIGAGKVRKPLDPRIVLAPSAILPRRVAASPPTVNAFVGANTLNPNQNMRAAALRDAGMITLCRAGNFINTSGGTLSPSYRTPRSGTGREPFSVQFGYDGSRIVLTTVSAPGGWFRISVDDEYVALTGTAGVGGGAEQNIDITFADARPRKIRVDLTSSDLYGLIWQPTATLWAIKPKGPRAIFMSDSWGGGAGSPPTTGYNGLTSLVASFADHLGWEDVWNSSIGGTGWISRNASQTNNFEDRVAADVIAFAPEVVLYFGGRNDYGSGAAAVGAAAGRTVAAVRAGLPDAPIVVFGPNGSGFPIAGTAEATWKPFQDAMFTAVAATPGVITVDTCLPGLITGSGKVSATTGSGNADVYIQSDGAHPNQAGADYLGLVLARRFLGALATA